MPALTARAAKSAKQDNKKLKEKYILDKIKEYAYRTYGRIDIDKGTGLLMVKKLTTLTMYGEVGWPDQEWSVRAKPNGFTFYIEGKKAGETPTDIQARRHEELRAMGFIVYVIDNVASGCNVIDTMVRMAKKLGPRAVV